MADKQSRLAEIYKAEKSKGGGIASTLGKRAIEKLDPRKFFNQKGFLAASLPSLFKSYSATPARTGEKIASAGSGSFSSGVLETKMDILTGETRDVKISSKISAKNSMSLPDMARDMNVMRQNITTLVKQLGGETTNKADMYFKKSSENEAAYENKFIKERGVKTTPTQVGAKPEEKKGIFATILEGLSSIFSMKGALIAGILAVLTLGIKEYFSNDEFKGKVDALVSDMFSTIKGFLIEYWKEVAIGLALLFPSATMALISSGISILSNGVTLLSKAVTTLAPLLADGLTFAVTRLVTLLTGPAGLILLLGSALFAARKLFDQNQEEYLKLAKEKKEKGSLSEKDEARLKQLNSPANEEAAEKQLGYNPITGKLVTQQQANRSMDQRGLDSRASDGQLKRQAEDELMSEAIKAGKDPSKVISNKDINTRFELLKKQRNAMNSAPNESGAETARLAGKATPVTPTPAAPSTTPTAAPSSTPSSSGQSSSNSLLDIIAGGESGSMGYDAANKGKAGDMPGGYPGLSKMTVNEVMRLQSEGKVFATGRYQIIPTTLAGLMSGAYGNTGVKGGDLYDASTQDKLGTALINKRLKQGGSDPIQQQFALSQEFASIANPYTGSSYYDKVGNNKASIGTQTIQAALTGTTIPSSTVVASAKSAPAVSPNLKMPTLGTLAAAAPSMGDMIEAATSEFTGALRLFDSALSSITNITNNNTQASAAAQQSQGALPSVYDDVFLNLFQRVT
jgi:hypothetical protein